VRRCICYLLLQLDVVKITVASVLVAVKGFESFESSDVGYLPSIR
jgi:hypothetical protein